MFDIRSYYGHQPSFRTAGTYESPLAFRLMHKHRILSKSNRSIRAKSEVPYETRTYCRPRTARNDMDDMYLHLITNPTCKPVFTQRLRPRVIQESNKVKLSCTVDGKPTPSVTWFKGRTPVTGSSSRYITKYQHGMCVLEISNCVAGDSGDYICKASNSVGSDETSATLFVEASRKSRRDVISQDNSEPAYLADLGTERRESVREEDRRRVKREIVFEPQIIQALQELTVYEGTTAMLQCVIEGKPFPEIAWFRDGEPIVASGNIKVSVIDNEARLVIGGVTLDDGGEYECCVNNKAGEASTKAVVVVKGELEGKGVAPSFCTEGVQVEQPLEGINQEESVETAAEAVKVADTESTALPSLPNFTKQLKSMNVNEAEEMRLTCEIECAEAYTVEWLRNNKSIPENPDFIRQSEGGVQLLTVHEMFPEDSGVFGLSATNSVGTRTTVCTVLVHEEAAQKIFDILDFPTSTNVQIGKSIHLECVVGGNETVEGAWYVNDVHITDEMKGFRTEKTEKGTGAQRLAIYIDEADEAIHEGYYKLELSRENSDAKLLLCASVHVQ